MIRRLAIAASAVLMTAPALVSGPVQAQSTYRYWSYWVGGDSWSYSARGPGFRVPPDAGVEGWRFVVSPKDGSQAAPPGTSSRYEDLCPNAAPAPADQKRVAVVIDPGPVGIAPVGDKPPTLTTTCVTVPASATGLQVLQKVATLRFHSSGLICGIGGFPSRECPGQSATAASASPASVPTPAVTPVAPVATPAAAVPSLKAPKSATSPSTSASATSVLPPAGSPQPVPSAVALSGGEDPGQPTNSSPPAWIAAIGAAMIAALLGLALLARRGRS